MSLSRRQVIRSAAALAATSMIGSAARGAAPPAKPATRTAAATTQANDRPGFAVIGCGGRGKALGRDIAPCGDIVAVCDVDRVRLETFNKERGGGKAHLTSDYRELLTRKDVDLIVIGSQDHWHAQMAADAMRAGKDVYCE